eukprot:comp12247_c0_seq1/m.7040 comp12247_c0_seq1/g.7040  ORF comp12247_c0_seq1/g.7040 comp12247_c0_seq1/m.7040 type:complete len:235 (-) comp12247_c0_seq1:29-733(-)
MASLAAPQQQHKGALRPTAQTPTKQEPLQNANIAVLVHRLRETFETGVIHSASQALEESRQDPYGSVILTEKRDPEKGRLLPQTLNEFNDICDRLYETLSSARQVLLDRINDNHNLGQTMPLPPLPSKEAKQEDPSTKQTEKRVTMDPKFSAYTSAAAAQINCYAKARECIAEFVGYSEPTYEPPRMHENMVGMHVEGEYHGGFDEGGHHQEGEGDPMHGVQGGGGDMGDPMVY